MSSVQTQKAEPQAFARFGKVVTLPSAQPTSQAADYKFWSDIAHYVIDGPTEIGICTVYRQPRRQISGVERHLRTPEILIPIDAPFVLPLYSDDTNAVDAFRVNIGEAVVVNTGIWHGACLPEGKAEASYFVIFRRNTPHEDVEKKTIPPTDIR